MSNSLSSDVKAIRASCGLRQTDLAALLEVDENTIGGWENGLHRSTPYTESTMAGLADVLRAMTSCDPEGRKAFAAGYFRGRYAHLRRLQNAG